jgi:HEAT repeat protein
VTASDNEGVGPSDALALVERVIVNGTADAADVAALVTNLGHARKLVQRRVADALAFLRERGVDVRPSVVAALQSPNAQQRWGAAFALSRLGTPPPEVLPVLVQALGAADGDVRWAAAEILKGLPGHPDLPAVLHGLLRAGSAEQRKMAAYCLREIGQPSVETEAALLGALHDSDVGVRLAALTCVARLATNRRLVAERLTVLLEDGEARVQRASAVALGELRESSPSVLAALRRAAASSDSSLQRAATRSLRRLTA